MKSLIVNRREILDKLLQPEIFSGVSGKNWNVLANIQAAAHILSNLCSPQRFIKMEGNPYQDILNPSPFWASFLDSPLASPVQRMEDLSKLYVATEHRNSDIENKIFADSWDLFISRNEPEDLSKLSALTERKNSNVGNKVFADSLDHFAPRRELAAEAYYCLPQRIKSSKATSLFESYALDVLSKLSGKVENWNLTRQIQLLVNSYGKYEPTNEKEICDEVRKVLNKNFPMSSGANFSNPMSSLIEKRMKQLLSVAKHKSKVIPNNKDLVRQ